MMPTLIGEPQSAFVKERRILDEALTANEVAFWAKRKKVSFVLLKLDFHKAFENIQWYFLDHVFSLISFCDK